MIKTIKEEEVIGQEESGLREWNEKKDEIGNIQDPYKELWRNPWDKKPWEGGSVII